MATPVPDITQMMWPLAIMAGLVYGLSFIMPTKRRPSRQRKERHEDELGELRRQVQELDSKFRATEARKDSTGTRDDAEDFDFKVAPRRFFFSVAENHFFQALVPVAASLDLVVFPKVGLIDLFVDQPGAAKGQGNRYQQMHVDYLLVSRQDFKPVAGIELNGSSHDNNEQQHRDRKKRAVFKAAKVPLIYFYNQSRFSEAEIKEKLADALGVTGMP